MTMTTYTKEKKEHALSLMAAPHNKPVAEVMELTGIPKATLFLGESKRASKAVPFLVTARIQSNGVLPTSFL